MALIYHRKKIKAIKKLTNTSYIAGILLYKKGRQEKRMSLDFLTNYVVLVVFGTCICAGYIFKGIKRFPNDLIVPLLAIIGVTVNTWLNDWEFTPDILLGGLFSGLAATGTYEYLKRIIERQGEK